jgi:molybdenum cofactor synthesis domain-containing protein
MARTGAAAIIIGNEVLSAKVEDANGPYLVARLREHGLALRAIFVVPDEIEAIVGAVVNARAVARWVITSGGIGPTHDDVTVRAVAMALGREVVRLPRIVELLARAHSGSMPAEALRLAEAPEGTELLAPEGTVYPVLAVEGMFLLPGVPALFRLQLETVLSVASEGGGARAVAVPVPGGGGDRGGAGPGGAGDAGRGDRQLSGGDVGRGPTACG